MQPDEVKQLLQSRLSGCDVEVNGDGRHFAIRVIGEIFAGLSPVKKQQLVYGALSEEFASGSHSRGRSTRHADARRMAAAPGSVSGKYRARVRHSP